MTAVTITIPNPSFKSALSISYQERKKPEEIADEPGDTAPVRNFAQEITPDLKERLGEYGNEVVTVTIRDTTRTTQMPRWQAEDSSSLAHWIAQRLARRDSVVTARPAPKGVRYLDDWHEARPDGGIAASASRCIQLTDSRRVVVSCDEEIDLAISNPSGINSLRLRALDRKTGKTASTSIIQPFNDYQASGSLKINAKIAAVIEAIPQ